MRWKPRTPGTPAQPEGQPLRPRLRMSWAEQDLRWTRWLHRAASNRSLISLLAVVSRLGDGLMWYAAMAILPLIGGSNGWPCALRMMGLGALNLTLYLMLKRWACRPRPFVACQDIRACARALDQFSFPSGHTLHAVGFSIVLLEYYPRLAVVLVPFTILTAVSRVALGLHYPSDVIAGAMIGGMMASAVLALF